MPLLSGAFAGLAVDLSLFPLDTVKTRLQASGGFVANGGFRGVYAGMGSIAAGSAPGAALFFLSYESALTALRRHERRLFGSGGNGRNDTAITIAASSFAESLACLIRVPTEVVKQRTQTSRRPHSSAVNDNTTTTATRHSSYQTLRTVLAQDGIRGLYRGFSATLLREVPFVCIQFPLWEHLKRLAVAERGGGIPHALHTPGDEGQADTPAPASAGEAAICGAIAGSIAAAATTPLDVIKTRSMLHDGPPRSWLATAATIARHEGPSAFFRGVVPRVGWISVGGFIFLGGYSLAKDTLADML